MVISHNISLRLCQRSLFIVCGPGHIRGIWRRGDGPQTIAEADTVTTFKKHFDRHMNKEGIEGYGTYDGRWIN